MQDSITQSDHRQRVQTDHRWLWYVAAAASLTALSAALPLIPWTGDPYFHRMTETAAGMIAIMIGVMALTRHYSRKNSGFLLMGTAFVGTGLLDLYHGILTSPGIVAHLPSSVASVVPWSWLWSRLFLALMMIGGWLVWRHEHHVGKTSVLSELQVYSLAAALMASSMLIFLIVPLPKASFPDLFFHRPQELASAALFLLALLLHLSKGEWKSSRYEHWLIIGMVVECLAQGAIMARSASLHDPFFNAAHIVKPAGYLCVLTGLVINMYELFARLEVSLSETERTSSLLMEAQRNLEQRVRERTIQLDESQRFVSSVVEHLPNMVFVKDAQQLRFVQFNKAGEVLTGLSRDELLGRTVGDFFPKEQADFFTKTDREALQGGALVEVQEEPIQTRHHGIRLLRTMKIPIRNAEGGPQFLLGISEDITERKRADEALRLSEERLRLTLDVATDGLWDWQLPTMQATYSPSWIRLLGLEHQDVPLSNVADWKGRVHPEDLPAVEGALDDHLAGRRATYETEHRVRHRSGEWKWFAMRGQVTHRDSSGVPIRMMGTMVDITSRRQAEQARLTLQRAINHAKDGMALLDANGNYIYMNPAHAAMYGYAANELIGKNWRALYHSEWVSLIEQLSKPDLIATGNWQGEVVGKKRSGEPFHVEMSLAMVGADNADGATMVCTCRDITKRKMMERDLVSAKDAAESAARAKAEFLATMSHEIRTPMNGVIGMTGLLLDSNLTKDQRDYAETVRRSGEALLAIINDILDFSKIEAGKLTLEVIDFDLRTTVEETLDLLAEQAQRKNLELVGLIDAAVPTALRGDPGRLRQIMTNLIGNAVKFTEQGEVVLKLSAESLGDHAALLRFEVVDTGIGISVDNQARLFQSFSQADGSTTRRFGGTGLGLAISKQLVELMGGEIGVDSRPGEGSRFWFTVRLNRQVSGVPQVRPAEDLSGLRVCLIDDNATNRLLLEHHARLWGMTPASAADARQGLALVRDAAGNGHPFDLAVIDMQMPGMDGMELARVLREDQSVPAFPLVLLTSMARRGDAKIAQDCGFSAYLTKPIRQDQLYECLRLVMGKSVCGGTEGQRLVTVHSLAETQSCAKGRLLLAEDNVINQKVAVKMLEKLGYRVDVVANGEEALEALSRIPYALVFMDCQMPEMDGFEATRRIRQTEGTVRHTPIIAMTANAMQGDREHCLAAGMDDYVSKPIVVKDMKAAIDRWLNPTPAASTA